MLIGHLLMTIVGEDVQLCNYPFNYSDQCFHYLSHTAARAAPPHKKIPGTALTAPGTNGHHA
ncbi:hypothetical protein B0G77_8473 [Paraburkholderia sp. BL10I2N1]|nr:hypothetical protein B0G77_8473 [Paraburkholderia sp. BL10I2N1]